jgi:hypothetical protein
VQMRDLFDVIVVKIQEYQIWQTHQVFNFLDVVVLKIKQSQSFLTLQ